MKETFHGGDLRSPSDQGVPLRCRRPPGISNDALRCVIRLRDEARKYGLLGVEVLDAMPIEQLVADYNGIGPASFPPTIRDAINALVPDLRCVALIHDVRWAHSDGSVEQFKASNDEFAANGARVAGKLHKWHPLRRVRLKGVARIFANLCSGAEGWNAYLAARR